MSNETIKKIPQFTAFEIVNKLALFDGLSPEEKHLIADNQNIFYFIPEKDIFINEGDIEDGFYLILSGTARVEQQYIEFDDLNAGDIIGIRGFIREIPRTASVVAVTDILAIKYTRYQFKKLPLHVREPIKDHMLEELSKRIDRLNIKFHSN